jgi:hypothetical protein
MALVHRHSKDGQTPKLPKITRPWVSVGSGWIGISKAGKTPMWSTGFSGCIGVAMCGGGPWGAMAHLNQRIQTSAMSLELALTTLAEFINAQTKDKIREVLLYYGDPGHNLGSLQGANLTEAKVKELMKCKTVIDLRRKDKAFPYGNDFVYDPGLQIVYTAPAATLAHTGMIEDSTAAKELRPAGTPFPYKDAAAKNVLGGFGDSGWFFVP